MKLRLSLSFAAGAVVAGISFAQPAPVNLSDPKLSTHAGLPRHNPPGIPLAQLMSQSKAAAPSKGVVWKGLNIVGSDEEAVSPTVPVSKLLPQKYAKQACRADAIVVGHPTSSAFHLSSAGTGIYGDYIFSVETIVKDNAATALRQTPQIIVTRPGGSLTLSDGPVTLDLKAFPRLESNLTYLMFLRYLPQTSAYSTIDSLSTLVANDTRWMVARKAFSGILLPELLRGSFEATVTTSWLTNCK